MKIPLFEELTDMTFFLKGPFSQWHPSNFVIDGQGYCNAEHYMMFSKAVLFGDTDMAARIERATDPADHKRLGQAVRGFDAQEWDLRKADIVYAGNRAKFGQNSGLKKRLLRTAGTILVEANRHDIIWGIGLSETDPDRMDRMDRKKWRGENLLGRILTTLREEMLADPAR